MKIASGTYRGLIAILMGFGAMRLASIGTFSLSLLIASLLIASLLIAQVFVGDVGGGTSSGEAWATGRLGSAGREVVTANGGSVMK